MQIVIIREVNISNSCITFDLVMTERLKPECYNP